MKHNIPIYNFYLQEDIDKVKGMTDKYKVNILVILIPKVLNLII